MINDGVLAVIAVSQVLIRIVMFPYWIGLIVIKPILGHQNVLNNHSFADFVDRVTTFRFMVSILTWLMLIVLTLIFYTTLIF